MDGSERKTLDRNLLLVEPANLKPYNHSVKQCGSVPQASFVSIIAVGCQMLIVQY